MCSSRAAMKINGIHFALVRMEQQSCGQWMITSAWRSHRLRFQPNFFWAEGLLHYLSLSVHFRDGCKLWTNPRFISGSQVVQVQDRQTAERCCDLASLLSWGFAVPPLTFVLDTVNKEFANLATLKIPCFHHFGRIVRKEAMPKPNKA